MLRTTHRDAQTDYSIAANKVADMIGREAKAAAIHAAVDNYISLQDCRHRCHSLWVTGSCAITKMAWKRGQTSIVMKIHAAAMGPVVNGLFGDFQTQELFLLFLKFGSFFNRPEDYSFSLKHPVPWIEWKCAQTRLFPGKFATEQDFHKWQIVQPHILFHNYPLWRDIEVDHEAIASIVDAWHYADLTHLDLRLDDVPLNARKAVLDIFAQYRQK